MKSTYPRLLSICFVAFLCQTVVGETISLIENGDFDGDVQAWQAISTASEASAGSWSLSQVGFATPISGQPTSSLGGGENTYAIADQVEVSAMALFQTFRVPEDATSVRFGFDMFVNDFSLQLGVNPEQIVRVDILSADVPPLQEQGVFNAFLGNAGGPLPSPFASREFEILPFLETNKDYMARFYVNVNLAILNVGVDNVFINAEIVPEPTLGATSVFAAILIFAPVLRRRRA